MTLPNRARSNVRDMGTAPIWKRYAVGACAALSAVGLSGCDPVLPIAGAHFPAWLVCALAGALLAALMRPLFLALRIEAYLWPRPLVYSSLAVLLACIMYLLFFNRI
jgi:YtcA family